MLTLLVFRAAQYIMNNLALLNVVISGKYIDCDKAEAVIAKVIGYPQGSSTSACQQLMGYSKTVSNDMQKITLIAVDRLRKFVESLLKHSPGFSLDSSTTWLPRLLLVMTAMSMHMFINMQLLYKLI